jgi:hypothetical protein
MQMGDTMRDPELELTDEELTAMFALLDHPVPPLTADQLLARARRQGSRRSMLIAAAAVFAAAGVAAAAVPTATVRALVTRVFGIASPRASQGVAEAARESPASERGIAFIPRERAKIAFDSAQAAGSLRIRVAEERSVRIVERSVSRHAQFALSPEGVTVRNAASVASYELWLPVTLDRATVWVAGVRVFEKNGTSRSCLGALEADESCVIPMHRSPAR